MSDSDGSVIFGGTDAIVEDIIAVSDALVAVNIPVIQFNCNVVGVDQALKQATEMVEKGAGNWQLSCHRRFSED